MRNRGLSTADSDLSASTQRLAYRFRNVVAGLPVLLAVFVRWHECENDILVWTAAGMTFGLGWFIRIWAQQHLGFLLRKQTTLTRTGPYALVRNPIYIGNTLICIGLVVTSELLWLVPIALVVCAAAYSLTVHHEERYLAQRYGQPYLEYTRDPDGSRGGRSSREWSSSHTDCCPPSGRRRTTWHY